MSASTEHNPFVTPQAALDDRSPHTDEVFELNLFSASGRIGRVRYLGYSFGLSMLIAAVGGAVSAITSPIVALLAYAAIVYVAIMLAIKRSHDFNATGWLSLLVLVPLLNLLFAFVPGTDGPNRFGNKTAPNGRGAIVVVALVVAIPVLGILAAIAIPAYQQYAKRASAVQGAPAVQAPAVTR